MILPRLRHICLLFKKHLDEERPGAELGVRSKETGNKISAKIKKTDLNCQQSAAR